MANRGKAKGKRTLMVNPKQKTRPNLTGIANARARGGKALAKGQFKTPLKQGSKPRKMPTMPAPPTGSTAVFDLDQGPTPRKMPLMPTGTRVFDLDRGAKPRQTSGSTNKTMMAAAVKHKPSRR